MAARPAVLVLVAVLALPVAASAARELSVAGPDAKAMVLQLPDLPVGFDRNDGHYVTNAQLGAATAKDVRKLGRESGYYTVYTALALRGISAVTSFASIYRLGTGAHDSLTLSLARVKTQGGLVSRPNAVVPLGREARVYLQKATQSGVPVEYYTVAWRNGRVFAEVMGAGLAGTVDLREVVALAKKQDTRIAKLMS